MKVRDIFFMLMVQDMERAVRFYRDMLGLDVENHTPEWSRLALLMTLPNAWLIRIRSRGRPGRSEDA